MSLWHIFCEWRCAIAERRPSIICMLIYNWLLLGKGSSCSFFRYSYNSVPSAHSMTVYVFETVEMNSLDWMMCLCGLMEWMRSNSARLVISFSMSRFRIILTAYTLSSSMFLHFLTTAAAPSPMVSSSSYLTPKSSPVPLSPFSVSPLWALYSRYEGRLLWRWWCVVCKGSVFVESSIWLSMAACHESDSLFSLSMLVSPAFTVFLLPDCKFWDVSDVMSKCLILKLSMRKLCLTFFLFSMKPELHLELSLLTLLETLYQASTRP